jgi:hypothetical protein
MGPNQRKLAVLRAVVGVRKQCMSQDVVDPIRIIDPCFDKQRSFILDPARRKVAVTGRRAGKTVGDRFLLLYLAAKDSGAHIGYGAKTRAYAKDLMWRDLSVLAKKHFPAARTNETELLIELPNRSVIKLFGANDQDEADKARGFPFRAVVLDEVESIRTVVLKYLLEDVLAASLADYRGALICTGTPDASCMGYLYDIDQGERRSAWSHHHWTLTENPRFPQWAGDPDWRLRAAAFIAQELSELALDQTDPWVRREYFGEWVRSLDAFILHIDEGANTYEAGLALPLDVQYILGIDLGFRDESAFALTAFSVSANKAWHVTDISHPGMGMGEIVEVARGLIDRYRPIRTVVDPASGGANLVEELRHRYGVGVQYAEKENKASYFRLWNADIRMGRYFFLSNSKALGQARGVQWNEKFTREMEGPPCDLVDALLYAWREAYHYLPSREKVIQRRNRIDDDDDSDLESQPARRSIRTVRGARG